MAATKVIKVNTYIFGKHNSNSTYRLEIRVYTQVVNNGFFGKKQKFILKMDYFELFKLFAKIIE